MLAMAMRRRVTLTVVVTALGCFDASRAAADGPSDANKARCATAYERAQELQRNERLLSARRELVVCRDTCPGRLRRDCEQWLADVDAILPTVAIRPQGGDGRPLGNVRVTVDGELLGDAPKEPVVLDAGAHVLRFEHPDSAAVEARITLQSNERRVLAVTLWPKAPPDAPPESAAPERNGTAARALVIGGAAALLTGGGLAIAGHVERASLRSSCAPFCSTAELHTIENLWIASAVVAGLGAVAFGVGLTIWPTRPHAPATAKTRLWLGVGAIGGAFE